MKMKFFGIIGILILSINIGKSCSIVCHLPSELNENTYILEGRIIGYSEDYETDEISDKFGFVKLLVTRHIHAKVKYDTVYFAHLTLGSMCENFGYEKISLEKKYPIGEICSIVGYKMDFRKNEGNYLQKSICLPSIIGSQKNRKKYDFEVQRKMFSYMNIDSIKTKIDKSPKMKKRMNKEIKRMNRVALTHKKQPDWEYYERDDFRNRMNDIKEQFYLSDGFQAYLTLAKLKRTRMKKKRFKLLKKIIWSSYVVDTKFIEEQNISEKQKEVLISEFVEKKKFRRY